MISPALRKLGRVGATHPRASKDQRDTVLRLARELGIEPPFVHWQRDASTVIDRLKRLKDQRRQPPLEGFSASTGAGQ